MSLFWRVRCRSALAHPAGDFVDRGAWGVENLALLLAWKIALPRNVFLLRGNHATSFCMDAYTHQRELAAKYGEDLRALTRATLRVFEAMPLAALIGSHTLVLHGGLFRAPQGRGGAKGRGSKRGGGCGSDLGVGTLADLRCASKGGADPDGEPALTAAVAAAAEAAEAGAHARAESKLCTTCVGCWLRAAHSNTVRRMQTLIKYRHYHSAFDTASYMHVQVKARHVLPTMCCGPTLSRSRACWPTTLSGRGTVSAAPSGPTWQRCALHGWVLLGQARVGTQLLAVCKCDYSM